MKVSEILWEISLIFWIFFAASMWIIIRVLDTYFLIFQQVFLRSSLAVLMSVWVYLLFFWKLEFSRITRRDYSIFLLRSLLHLSAISLWILALLNTTLLNATLVGSVPATAILGVIFFEERLNIKALWYLWLSFLWAVLVSFHSDFSLWIWELYAFCASFLFSAYSLVRKKLSDHIGDREVSTLSLLFSSLLAFVIVLFFQADFSRLQNNYSIEAIIYLVLGAIVFMCISFFWVYGFKRVPPIKAASLEFLEIPFAAALWFIFFLEYPTWKDLIGWCLIILWAYLLLQEKSKKAQN